ncbi:MAG: hypothetical protein KJO69_04070, partial [Gammaproteobacteria bacterium]|nr:hypothetical protein [Gammaproteobacteria bacterium]
EIFTMDIPIYGVNHDYTMKLIGDFNTTLLPNKGRKVKMLVEVQEDLESILETAICSDFGQICN